MNAETSQYTGNINKYKIYKLQNFKNKYKFMST